MLKESHTHIVSRSIEETEKRLRDSMNESSTQKEELLNKTIAELKKKLEKETEAINNLVYEQKLDKESSKYQIKEQISKYERQLQEEVEKRQRISENLSSMSDKCDSQQAEIKHLNTK